LTGLSTILVAKKKNNSFIHAPMHSGSTLPQITDRIKLTKLKWIK